MRSIALGVKLYQDHVQYNLQKYSFSNRVIQIWNSLPDFVIDANNINGSKNKLDKFRANKNVKFNWRSDLTGSGGRMLTGPNADVLNAVHSCLFQGGMPTPSVSRNQTKLYKLH